MIQLKDSPTLDYGIAESKWRRHFLRPGVASFFLCIAQWPWNFLAGFVAWGFIWGDSGPEGAAIILCNLLTSAPSIVAVLLGLIAIRRSRIDLDFLFGAFGMLGGIGWIIWNWYTG